MDNGMTKKLAMLLNRIPKQELDKNLQKAKEILANSNKEDINNFLNSKPVSDLLGKNKEKVKEAINKNEINLNNLKNIDAQNMK